MAAEGLLDADEAQEMKRGVMEEARGAMEEARLERDASALALGLAAGLHGFALHLLRLVGVEQALRRHGADLRKRLAQLLHGVTARVPFQNKTKINELMCKMAWRLDSLAGGLHRDRGVDAHRPSVDGALFRGQPGPPVPVMVANGGDSS